MTRSTFMFATPSFVRGVGRLVDFGGAMQGTSYNISDTPNEADEKALCSDWLAVGDDMLEAYARMKEDFAEDAA